MHDPCGSYTRQNRDCIRLCAMHLLWRIALLDYYIDNHATDGESGGLETRLIVFWEVSRTFGLIDWTAFSFFTSTVKGFVQPMKTTSGFYFRTRDSLLHNRLTDIKIRCQESHTCLMLSGIIELQSKHCKRWLAVYIPISVVIPPNQTPFAGLYWCIRGGEKEKRETY